MYKNPVNVSSLFQLIAGLAFICLLLLQPTTSVAHHSQNELRASFTKAEKLLKQKRLTAWYKLKPSLKDYPLYPYLLFREIRTDPSHFSDSDISKRISQTDIPVPSYFMNWWLYRLQRNKNWGSIVQHYADASDTSFRCIYTLALLKSSGKEKAQSNLEKLWLSSRSRPKACDKLFQRGLKNGLIDDRLIWKRMLLTLGRQNEGLTKYLAGLLRTKEAKKWYHQLKLAHRNPRDELRVRLPNWVKSEYGIDVIHHAFGRIIRRNLDESVQVWYELKKKYPSAFSKLAKSQKAIGTRLALKHHKDAYNWLSTLPSHLQTTDVLRHRVRSALSTENWSGVLDSIHLMDEKEASGSEWIFWKARALYETGNANTANKLWRSIARETNFYGFLAADRLQLDYQIVNVDDQASPKELEAIAYRVPAIPRIREWLALDRYYSARRELSKLKNSHDDEFWQAAATLLHRWNWIDGAIRASYQINEFSMVTPKIFYPTPYLKSVRKESNRYSVSQHWIYGIMRQESLFIANIGSHAGAIGLMQLLPSTAREVARHQRLKKPHKKHLTQPSLNIRLGVAYFKRLLNRLGNEPIYALAGYNAGPVRSIRWKKRFTASDQAIWVETIPFRETRIYVKNVLANYIMYEKLYGKSSSRIRDYLDFTVTQQAHLSK